MHPRPQGPFLARLADVFPERIFRSEVAQVFRSLPKLVVEKMVDNLDLSNFLCWRTRSWTLGGTFAAAWPRSSRRRSGSARARVLVPPRCRAPIPLRSLTSARIRTWGASLD